MSVILLSALILPAPVLAEEAEGVPILGIEQQDLDGDGRLDLTVIDCAFITDHDRVLVYDRGGDMQPSPTWEGATDFENDFWVFDAAADGMPELVIDFYHSSEGLVADLWDDQDGDGTVLYEQAPGVNAQESSWPTVRVIAPEGWWVRGDQVNFNLDLTVDGPVRAASAVQGLLPYFEVDGTPDYRIQVRDIDADGRPDFHWVDVWPEAAPSWGIRRTALMGNPDDDEYPTRGSIFWPYLGSAGEATGPLEERPARFPIRGILDSQPGWGYTKAYGGSAPPIQMVWNKGALAYVGEFVASRFNDSSWFIYSINRLVPGTTSPANFEAPFTFYDLADDDDGYPEQLVRLVRFLPGDVSLYTITGTLERSKGPIEDLRYSWDQDNDGSWDHKIGLVGRHEITSTFRVGDLSIQTVPPADLRDWVNRSAWDGATFVVDEEDSTRGSEGVKVWEISQDWQRGFVTGLLDSPPADRYASIDTGFRGEYTFDLGSPVELYFSPVDRRLHLLGAQEGRWNLDDVREILYQDLDKNDYVDSWTLLEQGEVAGVLHNLAGFLIYADNEEVSIVRAGAPDSQFQVSPPSSHAAWLQLQSLLETYQPAFEPDDFRAILSQFSGEHIALSGATIRDFRPRGDGFRFSLEILPGYVPSSDAEFDGFAALRPGSYVVTYDGAFRIEPETPSQVVIQDDLIHVQDSDVMVSSPTEIYVILENRGLQDARNMRVEFYTVQDGGRESLDETYLDIWGGESSKVSAIWTPAAPGLWELGVEVYPEQEQATPASGSTVHTAVREVVVPRPSGLTFPNLVALGSGQSMLVFLIPALAGLAALVGAVTFIILLRNTSSPESPPDTQVDFAYEE